MYSVDTVGVTTMLLSAQGTLPMPTLILQLVASEIPVHDSVDDSPRVMRSGRAVKLSMRGSGALMLNVDVVLPPGVVTVTVRWPGVALRSTRSETVIDLPVAAASGPVTLAMVTPSPLTVTVVDPGTNDVPLMVIVVVVPATTNDGVTLATTGSGASTVKAWGSLVPLAVLTRISRAPNSAAASTVNRAVIEVLFTTSISLAVTPLPLISKVAPAVKPVPVNVATIVAPASPRVGVMPVRSGAVAVAVTGAEVVDGDALGAVGDLLVQPVINAVTSRAMDADRSAVMVASSGR